MNCRPRKALCHDAPRLLPTLPHILSALLDTEDHGKPRTIMTMVRYGLKKKEEKNAGLFEPRLWDGLTQNIPSPYSDQIT